jgi:hypothetical protein
MSDELISSAEAFGNMLVEIADEPVNTAIVHIYEREDDALELFVVARIEAALEDVDVPASLVLGPFSPGEALNLATALRTRGDSGLWGQGVANLIADTVTKATAE